MLFSAILRYMPSATTVIVWNLVEAPKSLGEKQQNVTFYVVYTTSNIDDSELIVTTG